MTKCIGIYVKVNWHSEILGQMYYLFNSLNYECIVYYDSNDSVDYIPYYKKIFGDFEVKSTISVFEDFENLDYILLLSHEDLFDTYFKMFVFMNLEKFIVMTHLDLEVDLLKRDFFFKSFKSLTLTPLVTKSNYILPIYDVPENLIENYIENNQDENECIAIIGWSDSDNKDFNDISNFCDKYPNKTIIFFTKQFKKQEDIIHLKKTKKNVKLYFNCHTNIMIEILKTVNYIWIPVNQTSKSPHITDRSTGALPLSYNNNIPVIVPKVFHDIYNLEGNIVYNKSICEIDFNKINRNELLQKMKIYKGKMILRNQNVILKMFNENNLHSHRHSHRHSHNLRKILPIENLKQQFQNDKPSCLITGGCGFVGSFFTEKLCETNDFNITVVDNISSKSSRPLSTKILSNINFIQDDLINYIKENNKCFDLVIHLAAVVGGRQHIEENPMDVAQDIIIDTEFFKWVIKTKPKKVIYFSSSAVYPLHLQTKEDHIKLSEDKLDFKKNIGIPDLTYGWSKLNGEYLARLAHSKYNIDIVCYRPFSGYGETQDSSYPFPAILQRAINKEDPLVIWSDSVRDFVHIDDIYKYVMNTYKTINNGSALNIGTSVRTSFVELAKIAAEEIGYNPEIKIIDGNLVPKGVYYRVAANKIDKVNISLREGIKKYIKYNKNTI